MKIPKGFRIPYNRNAAWYKEVVRLYTVERFYQTTIAKALGISVNRVHKVLYKEGLVIPQAFRRGKGPEAWRRLRKARSAHVKLMEEIKWLLRTKL
jgi:hypothetical protein